MALYLSKPVYGGFLIFSDKKMISRNADIDSAKQCIGSFKTEDRRGNAIEITNHRNPNIQQEYPARYYLSGFNCISVGMICWIVPDKNSEAILDSYSEPVIRLHDILVGLLDDGIITENEYWYPYIHVFERLARIHRLIKWKSILE